MREKITLAPEIFDSDNEIENIEIQKIEICVVEICSTSKKWACIWNERNGMLLRTENYPQILCQRNFVLILSNWSKRANIFNDLKNLLFWWTFGFSIHE